MTNAEVEEAVKNGTLSAQPAKAAQRPKDAPLPGSTLYLRLPSDSAIEMVKPVLAAVRGNVGVVLYIEASGAKLRAPKELCVTPTQALIDRLNDMLGVKNVVLK